MRMLTRWSRFAAVAALFGAAGCHSLDVQNPNNPDAERAFSDPGAVAGLITGAMRNWVQTRQGYNGSLVLTTMADAYSSSWNNWELNYHTSYGTGGGVDGNGGGDQFGCLFRCAYANTTSAAGTRRDNIEEIWYGFYGLLSSVNDVLKAIRENGVLLTSNESGVSDQANTDRHEAAAVMLQGVVFANIALNYDRGFIVDEATDISDPASLPLVPREEMRDAAIVKFDEAITLMTANPFTSRAAWTGAPGPTYSSAQLIQLVRTMQAELLAYFPRSAEENASVNWGQVTTYAAAGMSSGTPFDFSFFVDNVNMDDGVKDWGNAATLVKVDTRLANLITVGPNPALRHPTPWNGTAPQPDAFDARVGDGSWGPVDDFFGDGTVAETPNAGSDFAYTAAVYLNPSRGLSHYGNLAHIRYSYVAYPGYGLPGEDGTGLAPTYTATLNDLLWAEGLLRGGGSAALAAQKINNTRVNRGNLSTLTGGEGQAALINAMQYESEIELLGIGASAFYNRRRTTPQGWQIGQACPAILCLWPQTPRQIPIPAKELAVLQQEVYTFGGADNPAFAPNAALRGIPVWSAAKIADAMRKQVQVERTRRRR